MIWVDWPLNGARMIFQEFISFALPMMVFRVNMIWFMERHQNENYKLHWAMLQIQKKICALINDCHQKLMKWLCESYRIVLLPEFRTQEMIQQGWHQICSKTACTMCTWSHYHFCQHLHKACEHPWCEVVVCTEEYTSKMCRCCGHINKGLGGSKVFHCLACCLELDRDINGARNILLRYLTVNQKEPASAGVGAYPLGP